MKRDGNETGKPSGEATPSKKQKVHFADEKTLEQVKELPSTPLPAGLHIFIEVIISAFETKGSI